jgi:MFS family permease
MIEATGAADMSATSTSREAAGELEPVPPAGGTANTWELFNRRQRGMLLLVLFLVGSSGAIDRALVAILLEPIKQTFHVSDTALGLMTGVAFGILYAILGVPLGRYADRGDRRLLIAASVGLWSIFTAGCGWVHSFFQLFLLRIGVGIGEAGGTGGPAISLLSDYFPPERRAKAIGFVQMSTVSGAIGGLIAGGYIAQQYGWRTTFVVSGLPGVLLAALAWLALRDPRARDGFKVASTGGESTMDAIRVLFRKPSFVNITLALTAFWFVSNGPLVFEQAYIMRVLHLGIATTGATTGVISLASIIAGNMVGGILADRLAKRDIAWLCKLPAYGMMAIFPFYAAAHLVSGMTGYTLLSSVAATIMLGSLPAMMASLVAVVGTARRATGFAIALLVANLIGMTSGPVLTGMLSDRLAHSMGPAEGLRWAIIALLLAFFPTGWFMLRASRTIRADFEL